MTVFNLDPEEFEYGFRVDGPYDPAQDFYFDRSKVLLDPMARCITGRESWGMNLSHPRRAAPRHWFYDDFF